MRQTVFVLPLAVACMAWPSDGQGQARTEEAGCPYLPQYRAVQHQVAALPPPAAVTRLYAYLADPANENPAGCDAMDIESDISAREIALVAVSGGGKSWPAQAAFHCAVLDPRTTRCNGLFEDGTAFPNYRRMLPPGATTPFSGRIDSRLPDAKLVGLYRTTMSAVRAGRAATRITPGPSVAISKGMVLFAIFSAPRPWKYRKIVWYF